MMRVQQVQSAKCKVQSLAVFSILVTFGGILFSSCADNTTQNPDDMDMVWTDHAPTGIYTVVSSSSESGTSSENSAVNVSSSLETSSTTIPVNSSVALSSSTPVASSMVSLSSSAKASSSSVVAISSSALPSPTPQICSYNASNNTLECPDHTYSTVVISSGSSSQVWMAENLNYATAGSLCYGNKPENCATYGRLYDWVTAKKVCPQDWHLPSDTEWKILEKNLGMPQDLLDTTGYRGTDQGSQMKSQSTLWSGSSGGTNTSGFSGLPGGGYFGGNKYDQIGESGFWWTETEDSSNLYTWYRRLSNVKANVDRNVYLKTYMLSVRCLKKSN